MPLLPPQQKLRATQSNRAFQKRTLRALFAEPFLMPISAYIDQKIVGGHRIAPGMVASRVKPGVVSFATSFDRPVGLHSNFINGYFDELNGCTECGIWPLSGTWELLEGPDLICTPLDPAIHWERIREGTKLYSNHLGQLTISGYYSIGVVEDAFLHANGNATVLATFREPHEQHPYLEGYMGYNIPALRSNSEYQMGLADRDGDYRANS